MITVTKTYLPPLEAYQFHLERMWNSKWITNHGPLTKELTQKLKKHLGVQHMIPMTNGTLPLQIALNAFGKEGEIITTPFSYVATVSSIVWEKCTPVFVDIHPEYLTIDEAQIEVAITKNTAAILATHVYGNPCHVEVIEAIAKKHDLKVIYDAAHSFGVTYKGTSMFNYGDISTCSFHATKLFHTGEGGALFCQNEQVYHEMFYRHNFGHDGPIKFHGIGINAKMSELQAAMGLSVLPYMDKITKGRKEICEFYDTTLNFDKLKGLKIRQGTVWNYAYYPIILESEDILLKVESELKANDIIPRRYFFPSLDTLPYLKDSEMPIARDIAQRVLCLPLFIDLDRASQQQICDIINKNI